MTWRGKLSFETMDQTTSDFLLKYTFHLDISFYFILGVDNICCIIVKATHETLKRIVVLCRLLSLSHPFCRILNQPFNHYFWHRILF